MMLRSISFLKEFSNCSNFLFGKTGICRSRRFLKMKMISSFTAQIFRYLSFTAQNFRQDRYLSFTVISQDEDDIDKFRSLEEYMLYIENWLLMWGSLLAQEMELREEIQRLADGSFAQA